MRYKILIDNYERFINNKNGHEDINSMTTITITKERKNPMND